jgi:hypothetical protein
MIAKVVQSKKSKAENRKKANVKRLTPGTVPSVLTAKLRTKT